MTIQRIKMHIKTHKWGQFGIVYLWKPTHMSGKLSQLAVSVGPFSMVVQILSGIHWEQCFSLLNKNPPKLRFKLRTAWKFIFKHLSYLARILNGNWQKLVDDYLVMWFMAFLVLWPNIFKYFSVLWFLNYSMVPFMLSDPVSLKPTIQNPAHLNSHDLECFRHSTLLQSDGYCINNFQVIMSSPLRRLRRRSWSLHPNGWRMQISGRWWWRLGPDLEQ